MKEPVHKTKHPYLVGAAIACVVGFYFHLVSKEQKFPEPGPNLIYDITRFEEVDHVDTRFSETGQITPTVEDARAMAVDAGGRLYVAGKDAIEVFGPDNATVKLIPIEGTPTCLEFLPDGRLLVGLEDHIDVLDTDYNRIATWGNFTERSLITSIAADESDIFLADAASRCVLRLDHDGNVVGRIGETDDARDIPGLEVPSPYFDLAFDNDGELWVVNPGKLGLERYRRNGDIVTSWYRPSLELEGFSGCCNPTHIAFTSTGRLVTCEKGLVRVKIYEVTAGTFEELVVGSRSFVLAQGVRDMVVDASDRILVLDPRKQAVRVFEQTETQLASARAAQ